MAAGANGSGSSRRILAIAALVAAMLTLGAGGALAAGAAAPPADEGAGVAGTPASPVNTGVIVQWQDGTGHAERVAARADAGVTYSAELGDPRFQLVEAQGGQSAAVAARALEADPAVAVAEPDVLRRVYALPNDPLFAQEWGLDNTGQTVDGLVGKSGNDINVLPAWERTVGTPNIVVADIDTGYRADSPDLGPVEWTNSGEIGGKPGVDDDHNGYVDDVHGWDFVGEDASSPTEDADPEDTNLTSGGHGVHTAGTIGAAGNNGTGITGVAQNARIMPLRVCTNQPVVNAESEARCPTSAIIAAINYAGNNGARVANMSLGGTVYSQLEVNAFAAHPGTLYVIAAGNDATNNDTELAHYPCDYKPATESSPVVPGAIENTICVAALDPGETLASYSDYGATSVDLGAPGTAVLSTFPGIETLFSDNFETNDFASKWSILATVKFSRAAAGEGPLTSFGITDTPGATTTANQTYGVKLANPIAVASGTGACRVEGKRFRKGGSMPYGVYVDGSRKEFNGGETEGSVMVSFRTILIPGLAGHSVAPFFEYHASAAPAAGDGLWLDDVALTCNSPLTVPPVYAFLQGTSMATPHVSGAAALLFSLKPSASVTEVRNALLGSTTPVAALAGKTVTGGRLNVAAAMNQLVPLPPTEPPPGGGTLPPGTVKETEEALIKASPPATIPPPAIPPLCTVPKLAGKTLGQAKAALSAAGCRLGNVVTPKGRHGAKPPKLVVKSSTPAAGSHTSSTVSLTLAPKPKPKPKHH